jgi:hypothetical protein
MNASVVVAITLLSAAAQAASPRAPTCAPSAPSPVRLDRARREYDGMLRYLSRANVEVCADQSGQAAAKMKRLLAR